VFAAYHTHVRLLVRRTALGACAAALLLVPAAAASRSTDAAERRVTIDLYGRGKALWKLASPREKGRVSLAYTWHGTLSFAAPRAVLRDPRHRGLAARASGTLVAGWTGRSTRTVLDQTGTCRYRGVRVRARVTARLAQGRTGKTVELILHPQRRQGGFFSDRGRGASVRCTSPHGSHGPSHFAPSWFFRDNLQDHGRLTSDTAIVVLPRTVLPRGKATVRFPSERGRNNSVALGRIAWTNRAETAVRAR